MVQYIVKNILVNIQEFLYQAEILTNVMTNNDGPRWRVINYVTFVGNLRNVNT